MPGRYGRFHFESIAICKPPPTHRHPLPQPPPPPPPSYARHSHDPIRSPQQLQQPHPLSQPQPQLHRHPRVAAWHVAAHPRLHPRPPHLCRRMRPGTAMLIATHSSSTCAMACAPTRTPPGPLVPRARRLPWPAPAPVCLVRPSWQPCPMHACGAPGRLCGTGTPPTRDPRTPPGGG